VAFDKGAGAVRLSDDERELARLLGSRVAVLAVAVRGSRS
jgi:hypothetical protein